METAFTWIMTMFGYGIGIAFCLGLIYAIFYPVVEIWRNYKRKRDARNLINYTVWVKKENMNTGSIKSVQKVFNEEIVMKKSVKLDEIISVTYSPHMSGYQFTLWYKEVKYTTSWWSDFVVEVLVGVSNRGYAHQRGNGYSKYKNKLF